MKYFLFHCALIFVCIGRYIENPSPTGASLIFDVYIISLFIYFVLLKFTSFRKNEFYAILIFILFSSAVSFHYFYLANIVITDLYEFLRSFRYIVYLLIYYVLALAYARHIEVAGYDYSYHLVSFFKFLSVFFLISYIALTVLTIERPSLFAENNFEIPMLISMWAILSDHLKERWKYIVMTIAILSLSKSGVLAMAFVYFFSVKGSRFTMTRRALQLIVAALLIYAVFILRDVGFLDDIDRYRFLQIFFQSYDGSNVINILFGHGIAAELPVSSCLSMQYYSNSIHVNPAYCNSVVFHSFLMKSFYDTGFIGTCLFLLLWFRAFTLVLSYKKSITLMGIFVISSLSVSGFGNSIILWSVYVHILAFILVKRKAGMNRLAY